MRHQMAIFNVTLAQLVGAAFHPICAGMSAAIDIAKQLSPAFSQYAGDESKSRVDRELRGRLGFNWTSAEVNLVK